MRADKRIIFILCAAALFFCACGEVEPAAERTAEAKEVQLLKIAESAPVEILTAEEIAREEVEQREEDESGSANAVEAVSGNEASVSEEEAAVSENEAEAVSENETAVSENEADTPSENEAEDFSDEVPEHEDLKPPMFLSVNGSPTLLVGELFDIHKYIGYGDDVDRNVGLEFSGSVDTAVAGTYPIKVTLRDDAGHTASQSLNVKVVTELPAGGGGAGAQEPFSDFIAKYKTENTLVGIDISRWQEDVDFEKVAAAGCEFVYMRIGGRDEGEPYTDRYYAQNMAGAKAAGLLVGVYWHAEESNAREVVESVNYLMGILGGETLDLPIAYDWEDFARFEDHKMNFYDLNENLDIFVDEVEKRGYKGCLYNSKYYLDTVWTSAAKHPLWMAQYVSAPTYAGQYFMWQHGSNGSIDGVNGYVDMDVLYLNALP